MSNETDQLLKQAFQARREHRLDDAKRDLNAAVDLCRGAGVRADLAKALTGLGQIERDLKHGEVAQQHYEEAVAIYRVEGDALRLAHTIRHVGDIHQDEGHLDLAEPCYHEALAIYRSHEQTAPLDLANTNRGLALLKGDTGEHAQARLLWEEARDLYAAVDVEAGVAESSRRLAQLAGK
jgi:tetratricopeptide (TPR) repeat protein